MKRTELLLGKLNDKSYYQFLLIPSVGVNVYNSATVLFSVSLSWLRFSIEIVRLKDYKQ